MAQRFDLDLGRKIHELSKGNQQKVAVIQLFSLVLALALYVASLMVFRRRDIQT